jgi:hypothetical protein
LPSGRGEPIAISQTDANSPISGYTMHMLEQLMLFAALVTTSPPQAGGGDPDPAQVTEIDAIECRLDVPSYQGFALALEGEEKLATKRQWKKVASANPLLLEYELPAPITVAGTYTTRRIAFSSDAILAVLDLADPAVIADGEKIANTMDAEPMIDSIVASGRASRAEAERLITFRKFLGERVIKEVIEPATGEEQFGSRTIVARSISNASTHRGKTLYGCGYRMEILDKDGAPL